MSDFIRTFGCYLRAQGRVIHSTLDHLIVIGLHLNPSLHTQTHTHTHTHKTQQAYAYIIYLWHYMR